MPVGVRVQVENDAPWPLRSDLGALKALEPHRFDAALTMTPEVTR